jgi:hypothetical protein
LGSSTNQVFDRLQQTTRADPSISSVQNLIATALVLQTAKFTYLLAVAGAMFFISISTLAILMFRLKWSRTSQVANGGNMLRRITLFFMWTSAGLAFAAAYSLSQVTVALEFQRTNSAPKARVSSGRPLKHFTGWHFLSIGSLLWALQSRMGAESEGASQIVKRARTMPCPMFPPHLDFLHPLSNCA